MSASVGRRLSRAFVELGSIGIVVAGMAAIDERVRRYLLDAVNGDVPVTMKLPDLRIQHLSHLITQNMGLSTDLQFPLVIFAIFGFVLFFLMFRT